MPVGRKPWIGRKVRKVVSRAIERNTLGRAVRRSLVGEKARELKARTRGITLSTREFETLVRRANTVGPTDELIARIRKMTGKQKKTLFARLNATRRKQIQPLL